MEQKNERGCNEKQTAVGELYSGKYHSLMKIKGGDVHDLTVNLKISWSKRCHIAKFRWDGTQMGTASSAWGWLKSDNK
ncbi:hypothetical protein RchiOBHm_Chr3g0457331 [Rosa chinensis]|uniref:Uncharacterized protein n=1 Tax=Rosa chinensis TaxID=74649 RepID=A0A2P6R7J6_ROSCH|nr:hypothetical protein RchiOBHm_Chr3g0457331 [Rosa chinensis]